MGDENPLTEKLRPHVASLQAAASGGDPRAQQVIDLYQMHVSQPSDPGAPALCGAAFDEWMSDRAPTVT